MPTQKIYEQQQPVQEPLPTFTEEELLGTEKPTAVVSGNLQGETVPEFAAAKAAAGGTPIVEPEPVVPGNLQGETVPEFAAAKAAAGGTPESTPNAKPPSGATPTTGTENNSQTTQDSGQANVVTTPSKHLFDYANNSLGSIMNTKDNNVPVRQLLDDYFKWCQENGKVIDYVTVNDIVNKTPDLSKSPIENEKEKKKAERKAKFDQVGNFLLHLGNAIGNVAGGGYASMKLEDPIKFSERQRMLKEKADQQRIANNQSVFQQMQKGWADQRAQEIAKKNAEHQAKMEQISAKNAATAEARQAMMEKWYANQSKNNDEKTAAYVDRSKKAGEAAMINATKPRAGRSNPYKETKTERTITDAKGNILKRIASWTATRPYSGKGRNGQGNGLKKLPTSKK